VRLVSFDGGRVGIVDGESVIDATSLVPGGHDLRWPASTMPRAIADFDAIRARLGSGGEDLPRTAVSEVAIQSPVPHPGQLIALPANYDDHIGEMSSPNRADRNGFFVLSPTSISGPREPVVLPELEGYRIDHECELALVIGRSGFRIAAEDALEHIFGYSCLIDVTVRGPQERAMRKSFPSFTPLGPHLVTRDEVADPDDLRLRLSVNGQTRHDGTTADMIVGVREAIVLISSVVPLAPGDVIATGTPAGVAAIAAGDRLRIEVEDVGAMELDVVQGEGGSNVAFDGRAPEYVPGG
jgi:2-keto-4-pentenoate hydratase/2-oxohepta-3-ene-1,7-dioic acid hydratase in catechol pathway